MKTKAAWRTEIAFKVQIPLRFFPNPSKVVVSWSVMALLGDAVCCASNLDVLESESLSLEMTHFRVLVSAITKSLSKLILLK